MRYIPFLIAATLTFAGQFSTSIGDNYLYNISAITTDFCRRLGVGPRVLPATDDRLRPIDGTGRPVYTNLHAVGAILGGAVPWKEKSGTGISVATGYAAAEAILAPQPQPVSEAVG